MICKGFAVGGDCFIFMYFQNPPDYKIFLCPCLEYSQLLSRVQLFATAWSVTYQVPLSMGFSRQEYRSVLPRPPPGDLPDPRIKPEFLMPPALAGGNFYH